MYYFTMLQMEERAGEILSNIFKSTEYFKKILKNKNINIKVLDFIIRLASLGNINYKKYFLDKGILDLIFNLINEEEEVIIKVINIISEFYSNFCFKNIEKREQDEINNKMFDVLFKNYKKLCALGCRALISNILNKLNQNTNDDNDLAVNPNTNNDNDLAVNPNTNNDNDLAGDQMSELREELSIKEEKGMHLSNLEENSNEKENARKIQEQERANEEGKDKKKPKIMNQLTQKQKKLLKIKQEICDLLDIEMESDK